MQAGLVDRIVWLRAPMLIGGDGIPASRAFGVGALGEAPRFVRRSLAEMDGDALETYVRAT
jgi:diaminohydroxyphosphoribosylaminopyrimidine deaminase/5-amino-6-(5-phosphoribosylamino)uracil reductase